jgi:hypothetical protein
VEHREEISVNGVALVLRIDENGQRRLMGNLGQFVQIL